MESNKGTDIDKLISYGQMALEQGWYDQARDYFEQALALDADNREAMKGLARVNEILSRREAMAIEPMEAETPTGPPLAKRIMVGVNSVFEALEEYRQKRARAWEEWTRVREEQSQWMEIWLHQLTK
jgi:Tfp pilus assembly protein PilF